MKQYVSAGLTLVLLLVACGSQAEADPADQAAPGGEPGVPAGHAGSFLMPVGDVFTVMGIGVVVTGRVETGSVSVGDTLCVGDVGPATVQSIESFRKVLETAGAGMDVALVLEDVAKEDIERGMTVTPCGG